MALKIWLNGSMNKIDTNLHKPVTFINGTKYKLDKAWTFVNGQKYQIWGEQGVVIDYISSTGSLGGGKVVCISENWLIVSFNKTVYNISIKNLNRPLYEDSKSWGNVMQYATFISSSNQMIFWAEKNGTTYNKIVVVPSTWSMSVSETKQGAVYSTSTPTTLNGFANEVVKAYGIRYTSSGIAPIKTYEGKIYFGTTEAYTIGTYDNPLWTQPIYGLGLQDSSNSILINMDSTGIGSAQSGVYRLTPTTYTRVAAETKCMVLLDGTKIIKETKADVNSLATDLEILNKSTFSVLHRYNKTGTNVKFIGKLDNYYYLLDMNNVVNNKSVKLVLINSSTYAVAYTKTLPNDPFNEYSNDITFWINCENIAQISQTGFLGIGTYNSSTLGLRVVRFSSLI